MSKKSVGRLFGEERIGSYLARINMYKRNAAELVKTVNPNLSYDLNQLKLFVAQERPAFGFQQKIAQLLNCNGRRVPPPSKPWTLFIDTDEAQNTFIRLYINRSEHFVQWAKMVLKRDPRGVVYVEQTGLYTLTRAAFIDLAAYDTFRRFFDVEVCAEDDAEIRRLFDARDLEELATLQAKIKPVTPNNINGKARPYQELSIGAIIHFKRLILSADIGLGKTFISYAFAAHLDTYPMLAIVPLALKDQWIEEQIKWTPNVDITTNIKQAGGADILIVHYEQVKKFAARLKAIKWRLVVLDESQFVKNAASQRTKAVVDLLEAVDPEYVIALTGTPVENRASELIGQLQAILQWHRFPNFAEDYGLGRETRNPLKLHKQLLSTCYLRLRKEDHLKDLPPLTRSVIPLVCTNRDELKEWEDLLATGMQMLAGSGGDPAAQQIALAMIGKAMMNMRTTVGRGKRDEVLKWTRDYLERTDEKVILFAAWKPSQDFYFQGLRDFGAVHLGKETGAKHAFQNDPNTRVIICRQMADRTGHNLQAGSTIIIPELQWNPAVHDQMEGRGWRSGQTRPCSAYYFLDHVTIDGYMWDMLGEKRSLSGTIVNGREQSNKGIRDGLRKHLNIAA